MLYSRYKNEFINIIFVYYLIYSFLCRRNLDINKHGSKSDKTTTKKSVPKETKFLSDGNGRQKGHAGVYQKKWFFRWIQIK